MTRRLVWAEGISLAGHGVDHGVPLIAHVVATVAGTSDDHNDQNDKSRCNNHTEDDASSRRIRAGVNKLRGAKMAKV